MLEYIRQPRKVGYLFLLSYEVNKSNEMNEVCEQTSLNVAGARSDTVNAVQHGAPV